MGLMEPKMTPSPASNSEKLSPTSSQPDKEKDKSMTLPDCQILTMSEVSDTSEGEISTGDSLDDSDGCRTKTKKGKIGPVFVVYIFMIKVHHLQTL